MNLPNILTLSRLGFAFVIMVLLTSSIPFAKTISLVLFVIAGITDYLDGYFARKMNIVSSFGKLMDPLTDKVMVCALYVSFVEMQFMYQGRWVPLIPAWIVVVIISREFLVTGLRLLATNRGVVIAAGKWGKHKTVWQIVSIVVILLALSYRYDFLRHADAKTLADFDFGLVIIARGVAIGVALITVASGFLYFQQHRDLTS